MPSLAATTSTPARKPFVRTHYVRTNICKPARGLDNFRHHAVHTSNFHTNHSGLITESCLFNRIEYSILKYIAVINIHMSSVYQLAWKKNKATLL